MICKNCGAYFVRDPCPSCGARGKNAIPDENKSNEKTHKKDIEISVSPSQVLLQQQKLEEDIPSFKMFEDRDDADAEEELIKPSERGKTKEIPSFQRIEQEEEDDEVLVKPSQKLSKQVEVQDIEEQLVKPSERLSRQIENQDNIPSFKKYEKEVRNQQITKDVEKIQLKAVSESQNEGKLKNDKEYRKRVKDTLMEVMGILEKLIE